MALGLSQLSLNQLSNMSLGQLSSMELTFSAAALWFVSNEGISGGIKGQSSYLPVINKISLPQTMIDMSTPTNTSMSTPIKNKDNQSW